MLIGIGQFENSSSQSLINVGDGFGRRIWDVFNYVTNITLVFIPQSPFINPELLEIEKKTCRIASCEMVFESVAARLLHEQEFKELIFVNRTQFIEVKPL